MLPPWKPWQATGLGLPQVSSDSSFSLSQSSIPSQTKFNFILKLSADLKTTKYGIKTSFNHCRQKGKKISTLKNISKMLRRVSNQIVNKLSDRN